jgi:sulfonate transport system permease protein
MSTTLPAVARATSPPRAASAAPELETLRPTLGRRRLPRPLTRLTGVVLAVALWQLLSSTRVITPDVLGSPWTVARDAGHLIANGELGDAIGVSLQRVAWGLLLGGLVGTVLALITGLSRIGEDVVDAPVQMLRTVPFAGIIPLLIVWLGVGETPKIALISLGVCFPLYINVLAGVRSTDPALLEAGRTLGLSRLGLVLHVVLPSALPNALVGVRIALGTSWLALVFAEQISATSGLGYLMSTAQELLQSDTIVVCLATYAVLGLLADLTVRSLERVLLRWQPRFLNGAGR